MIIVRDNGRGIPPEQHERIFEVFQSLGPRRDGARGTGMGLAIVRKIAETQGGHAWVESEPGRGACFKRDASPPPSPLPVRADVPDPLGALRLPDQHASA